MTSLKNEQEWGFPEWSCIVQAWNCGITQRVKVRFDSTVKDRKDAACQLRGRWIWVCQHWIHKDNSSLIIALLLRTWAKRTKALSPHLKFAFPCDYLSSAVSLVHLVLLTSGSEVLYLFTMIWAHSPMLLHCRISKDMMQQYFLNFFGCGSTCHCCQSLKAIQIKFRGPWHFRKKF